MEDIKACRICLVMDIKMYNLRSYPLETYFESIIGINPVSDIHLPSYACFECASLVKKYYLFRERCLRGQAALCGILRISGKITFEDLKQVDRKNSNLTSNLKIQRIVDEGVHNYSFVETNFNIKEEDLKSTETFDTDSVKQEEYDDFPQLTMSSDDDEPLSLHKSIKEKKPEKERVRIMKTSEQFSMKITPLQLQDIQVTDDISALPPEITNVEKPQAKRGPTRKTESTTNETKTQKCKRMKNKGGVGAEEDVDLEEHVTIIKLTVDEQIEEITKRQTSSNYLNATYQCSLCYKGFINSQAWQHHLLKHDPKTGDVECPICKFRFKTKRLLKQHGRNHEKKYACKSCPDISNSLTQAERHQRWHKGVTYKCQYCGEVSTKWTSHFSHVRNKHPSEFICGVCGYSFVSKLGLSMHKTLMHKDVADTTELEGDSEQSAPYCSQCDVQFVSSEAWKRHMVTSAKHTQSTHFNNGCRDCGGSFKNAEELRVHRRKEHPWKRPKNYGKKPNKMSWPAKCEHCSEVIQNGWKYWVHFRREHPDKYYPLQKNYVCDICGKSFRNNAFLVYHKRTHTSERGYKCLQCPKAFFNRTNLQMHEKTHSDHRPYPCNVCTKAFKCKGALNRHSRSHTGVKPYVCEVCGKTFSQSNSRKSHVLTVHMKQPMPHVSRKRAERRKTRPQKEPLNRRSYNKVK